MRRMRLLGLGLVLIGACDPVASPQDVGPLMCGTETCTPAQICFTSSGGVDTGTGPRTECLDVPTSCPPIHDCDTDFGPSCAEFTCFSGMCNVTGASGGGGMSIRGRRLSCSGV